MKIVIETVPQSSQRYDTCGDWQWDGDTLNIKVSETGNWIFDFLIGRHELDEAMLCKRHGITELQVDEYDSTHSEAGSDDFSANTAAPYYTFHNDALAAEWLMARLMDVDWRYYSMVVEKRQRA